MAKIKMSDSLARGIAADVGNRSMRKAGRKKWSKEDFNDAAREYNRLTKRVCKVIR